MSHVCPSPTCKREVPDSLFACRSHWFSLPKPLRNAVWFGYREHGEGSPEHLVAMRDARDWLREKT